MKRIFSLLFAVTLLFVTASTSSCAKAQDDASIIAAFSALAPKAHELYGIVYGDVLPHEKEAGNDGYYAVSSDAEYQSIAELKAAMNQVFSSGYLEILYNTAFSGVSEDEGAIDAKFVEKDGALYVNPDVTSNFGSPREFDFASAEVLKANPYKAIVSVPVTGADSEALEVSMQMAEDGWRIDSAIY